MFRPSVVLFCAVAAVTDVHAVESQIDGSRARLKYAWLDVTDIRGKEVTGVSVNGQILYPRVDNHFRYAMHLADESVIANVHVTFQHEKPWSSEFVARAGETYTLHFHAAGAALAVAEVSQATIEAKIAAAESIWRELDSELKREAARRVATENEITRAALVRDMLQGLIPPLMTSIQGLDSDFRTKEAAAVLAKAEADAACRLQEDAQRELDNQTALLDLVADLEKRSQGPEKLAAQVLLAELTQRRRDAETSRDAAKLRCQNASTAASDRREEADAAKQELREAEHEKESTESAIKTIDDTVKMSSGKLEEIKNRIRELTDKIWVKEIEIQTLGELLPPEAQSATTPETTPEIPPAGPSSPPPAPPSGSPPAGSPPPPRVPPTETPSDTPPPPPTPPSDTPPPPPPAPPTETPPVPPTEAPPAAPPEAPPAPPTETPTET